MGDIDIEIEICVLQFSGWFGQSRIRLQVEIGKNWAKTKNKKKFQEFDPIIGVNTEL